MRPAFLLAALLLAQPAIADYRLEAGTMILRGDRTPVVAMTYQQGFIRGTAHYRGSHRYYNTDQGEQYALGAQVVHSFGSLQLGVGPVYLRDTDWLNGSRWNFNLSASFALNERWSVSFWHWSNAGRKRPNVGSDFVTIGYRF